jgi:hypothetical protein
VSVKPKAHAVRQRTTGRQGSRDAPHGEAALRKVADGSGTPVSGGSLMRFAMYGLIFAALLFVISGGHIIFLPLFFLLPLGGMFGHRRRHGHFWYRTTRRY